MARVQDFYQGLFDLACRKAPDASITFQTGLSQLHFTEKPEMTGVHQFAFNISADQVAAAHSYLRAGCMG